MKIGVISDIHANFAALQSVFSTFQDKNIDHVLCAGDMVGYYGSPNRTISYLQDHKVKAVRGNHDEAVLNGIPESFQDTAKFTLNWTRKELSNNSIEFLKSLPLKREEKYGSSTIYIVHGSPKNPLTEYVHKDIAKRDFLEENFANFPDFVVLGHTHRPFVNEVDGTTIVNPGSVGQPRDGEKTASFGIIDIEYGAASLYRAEYEINDAIAEVKNKDLPNELANRLKKGR